MKIILSAPTKSGYRQDFETVAEARAKAANLLGLADPSEMIEYENCEGDDIVTYCYASQDEADADRDGSYAVRYSR